MWPFKIVIPGVPIAWKRPAQKSVGRKHWTFDSQKEEKEIIRLHLSHRCKRDGYKGPLFDQHEAYHVRMWFYLPINQSDNTSERNAKLWGLVPANEKPDFDNLTKFYLDCANGILWSDDKRIVEGHSKKFYSENPRTIIEIMPKQNLKITHGMEGVLKVFGPNELKELNKDIKGLSFLSYYTDLCLSENGEINREKWMALVCLLLSQFARSHADKLKKILKFENIEAEAKAIINEIEDEKTRESL